MIWLAKSGKIAEGQAGLKAKTAGRGTRFCKGHGRRDRGQLQELKAGQWCIKDRVGEDAEGTSGANLVRKILFFISKVNRKPLKDLK